MPEGPECYKLAARLEKLLKGKAIVSVDIHGGRYASHGPPQNLHLLTDEIDRRVESNGVRVVECCSKGKLIYITLDCDLVILSTLGLMGKWTTTKSKHCDLSISFKADLQDEETKRLFFKDQIHYGTFAIIRREELPKKLRSLGADVLQPSEFTWEKFHAACLRNSKNTMPVFLMKQTSFCGIGNYLKAEIIYVSRASIVSPLAEYSETQLRRVYDACVSIPHECTFGKYRLKVYGKKLDPYRNKVYSVKTADKRTTHWVPAVCPIDIKTDRPAIEQISPDSSYAFGEANDELLATSREASEFADDLYSVSSNDE